MCGVRSDSGFSQTSLFVNVLDGWEGSCSGVLGGFHHSLWGLAFSSSGAVIPDFDATIQNVLQHGPVEPVVAG